MNAEQYDKDFIKEISSQLAAHAGKYPETQWGGAGLSYIGDRIDDYRNIFEIKSNDTPKAWNSLIHLCKTLNDTPVEELPSKIEPLLDVEGALKFLALDVALVNSDGYWIRASDYCLYLDKEGVFHLVPHDANETFQPPMVPVW